MQRFAPLHALVAVARAKVDADHNPWNLHDGKECRSEPLDLNAAVLQKEKRRREGDERGGAVVRGDGAAIQVVDGAHQLERSKREAKRRAQALAKEVQARLFLDAVRDVTPLPASDKADTKKSKPEPIAKQRQRDEAQALASSLSDDIDIERLLQTDESLSWKRDGLSHQIIPRLRRGQWSVKAQLDLHGKRVDEAREALVGFLADAIKREIRCVRIVHGKGLGSVNKEPVLKNKVLRWLVQREEVLAFCQARPNDGGSGALIVLLTATRKS
nr:DNA mismatch repair protein MutS [Betaproteobacteria bacterium]